MLDFLSQLQEADVFRKEDIEGIRTIEAIAPTYADEFPPGLHGDVIEATRKAGITRLFEHQARAIERILSGKDIVLVSPTASGKTLAFAMPVVSELLQSPDSHALFIYPMKALVPTINKERYMLNSRHGSSNVYRVERGRTEHLGNMGAQEYH